MYKFIFILFLIFTKAFAQGSDPVLRVDYAFGGIQNDVLLDLLETTEDFSLVMAGYTNSIVSAEVTQNSFGNEDFWIIKQNIEEEIVWTNRFGGSENDRAHKIIELADGYLIVGSSNSPTSGNKTSNHYGGQDVWKLCPEYVFFDDGTLSHAYNYDFTRSDVLFYMEGFDLAGLSPAVRTNQIFRVVIIPGYGSNFRMDFNNYDQVMSMLGLSEADVKPIEARQ